ncbi:MAG TPA: hypothetical protein VK976_07260 [Verrucomicrobiae bacterium]|jgi:hypothetical protein|nr:hypothetical protein [Verrucomicrobiae bacterium]
MKTKQITAFTALCILGLMAGLAVPAFAQEKSPMYCYIGFWAVPRAQWADWVKADAADASVLQKAMAGGTLVGYGSDTNLVHEVDGMTHDSWWCGTSMSSVLGVLDTFYSNGSAVSPVMSSATKHMDQILVSRYYNWHSGTVTGGYGHASSYALKPDAPDDAIDMLAKSAIVPMMEKLLAGGTISEYEIDEEAIHTQTPGTFYIVYLTQTADGVDKVNAALRDNLKSNPLIVPAFMSSVDFSKHRDFLDRSNASYK